MAIKLHGSQILFCSILTNNIIKYIKKQKMRKLPASSVQGCSEEWLWRNERVPLLCCQPFSSSPYNGEKIPHVFCSFCFLPWYIQLFKSNIQKLCSCCHDMWRDPLSFFHFSPFNRGFKSNITKFRLVFLFFFSLVFIVPYLLDIYVTHGDSCTNTHHTWAHGEIL